MSKSYRRPYSAICGGGSAAWDKLFAHRGVRSSQNLAIRTALKHDLDWDAFLIPDIYECSHNEVYSWGRDGNQYYQDIRRRCFGGYSCATDPDSCTCIEDHDKWITHLKRK